MRTADRMVGWLLVVSALLHAFGSWTGYGKQPETLLWALSGTLAALLVAAINLLRVNRPTDRGIAAISLVGSLAWAAIAIGFGAVIGNVFDVRAMIHAVLALALAVMSARTYASARGVTATA